MKIRVALPEDAEKIAANNVLLARKSEGKSIQYETTLRGVEEVIDDENKGFYIVAEENGEIIGQTMVTYEWSDWRGKQIWWLQSIYVRKEYRKKGVMKAIINEIIKMAKEKNVFMLRLYVYKKNKIAMKAYEKNWDAKSAIFDVRVIHTNHVYNACKASSPAYHMQPIFHATPDWSFSALPRQCP